jgi:hypothetical protein
LRPLDAGAPWQEKRGVALLTVFAAAADPGAAF